MTMTCDRSRELFPEALYDELALELQHEFADHLAYCTSCSSEFRKLKKTLAVMNLRERPEPGKDFPAVLWDRVSSTIAAGEPRIHSPAAPAAPTRVRPAMLPAWAYGIAATILLAAGIYLGRTYFGKPGPAPVEAGSQLAVVPPAQGEDSVTARAVAYLERSKNLLIGLSNMNEEHRASLDLTRNQEVSRQLIEQANILTVSLNKPSQQQVRQLILDLEVLLLQLANIEVKPGVPAIELLQKGIDQKSILLKINLEEMRAMAHRTPIEGRKKTTL